MVEDRQNIIEATRDTHCHLALFLNEKDLNYNDKIIINEDIEARVISAANEAKSNLWYTVVIKLTDVSKLLDTKEITIKKLS